MNVNRTIMSGNLTRDAELRYTGSGLAVVTFTIAVNDRHRTQSGEWEDYANFVSCSMFGRYAEAIAKDLRKGLKVIVDGKLRWSQWERDGQKRSKLEVIAENIELWHTQFDSEYGSESKGGHVPLAEYDEDVAF